MVLPDEPRPAQNFRLCGGVDDLKRSIRDNSVIFDGAVTPPIQVDLCAEDLRVPVDHLLKARGLKVHVAQRRSDRGLGRRWHSGSALPDGARRATCFGRLWSLNLRARSI